MIIENPFTGHDEVVRKEDDCSTIYKQIEAWKNSTQEQREAQLRAAIAAQGAGK
jgi:hypothetical protein